MTALLDDALGGVLEAVWPTRCVCCERTGELLCDECAANLPRIEARWACPRCGAAFGWLVCSECLTTDGEAELPYTAGVSALEFCDAAARMIVAYKDKDERRLAGILAGMIADVLPRGWLAWADALCWVPCDEKAYRRRGFDHMEEIAQRLGERTGRRALALLHKNKTADQRGLNRQQREANIQASFRVDEAVCLDLMEQASHLGRAAHLILLDDVLTTGATLAAAARVLKAAGVEEVRVATVARVA